MKTIFTLLVLVSSLCYGQRTDTNIAQLPNPMPTWGGANGCGKTWANPAFPGYLMVRITCATDTLNHSTMQTADSGEPRLVSSDGKHIIVKAMGGGSYVKAFDPVTHAVHTTGISLGYGLQFGKGDPSAMYSLIGTKIHKIVPKADWSGRQSDVILFDFAACIGFVKPTWHGTFTIKDDDQTFGTAFSNKGLQSTGNYVVSWNATDGVGCEVYDSLAGTITNAKGKVAADDGGSPAQPLIARFYLHEGGGGRDPHYVFANATLRAFGGAKQISGCTSGPGTCLIDRPYTHQRGTSHVVGCSVNCDGHSAKGYADTYTGKGQVGHPYGDSNNPTVRMVNFPVGFPDQHGAANFQSPTDNYIFMVSTDVGDGVIPYPIWGYNEVLMIPTDGSLRVFRLGQTLNSGDPTTGFICSNAVGVDGPNHSVYFTSDAGGLGVLGKQANGTDRCDVFALVKL
jgi:hypothetical protein